MRFGWLGDSREALDLARALVADGKHELVVLYDVGELGDELRRLFPRAEVIADFSELLHGGKIDAAIVARDHPALDATAADRHGQQLCQLAQADLHAIVLHPAGEPLAVFETDMNRQESGCVLLPFFPGIGHPAIERLAVWASDPPRSPIGPVRQLVVERGLARAASGTVWRQLARDATLVGRIIGEIDQVSAVGPLEEQADLSGLTVHLRSQSGIAVRWTVLSRSAASPAADTMTLIGDGGSATLKMVAAEHDWELRIAGRESVETLAAADSARVTIAAFTAAVTKPAGDRQNAWLGVCRDMEIVEAAGRSLKRRRTIDLLHEPVSEDSTFKGVMAAGGCLLLMLSLLMLIGAAIGEGLRLPFRDHILWRIWPLYVLVPLLVFLLLQFLRLAIRRPNPPESGESA